MPKRKESGADGRKRRKREQELRNKLAGSLKRFVFNTPDSTIANTGSIPVCPESANFSLLALEADVALINNTNAENTVEPLCLQPVSSSFSTVKTSSETNDCASVKSALEPDCPESENDTVSSDSTITERTAHAISPVPINFSFPMPVDPGTTTNDSISSESNYLLPALETDTTTNIGNASFASTVELACSEFKNRPNLALEANTAFAKDALISEPSSAHSERIDVKIFTDIGYWPENIDKTLKNELVKKGTSQLQNKDAFFPRNINGRSFSKDWFYKNLDNDEKILRTWLLYSPVKNAVFCFPCTLFKAKGKSSFAQSEGFKAWKKLNPRLLDHEKSCYHVEAFEKWKEFEMRLLKHETIDTAIQIEQQKSFEKWKAILKRILDCVLYLARQSLPLRGHSEDLSASDNCGNFLETFKLLARYDPVADQHLTKVQQADSYVVSYLSPQSQNEFIKVLGDHIRTQILQRILRAKYFSIMFDSTTDISHIDQMSQIIRYVHIEENNVTVQESFIDFIQLTGKSANEITEQICSKLQKDGLKFEHCYGQGYDNAATMAGHVSGVQKRILDVNPKAVFVPCNNHSLNLAGVHAASVGIKSVTFFGTVQKVYTFFSSSTHRWEVLKKYVPVNLKRFCDTRWCSKHEAVNVFYEYTEHIIEALESLRDGDENIDTKGDAGNLLICILTYPFFAFLYFWSPVLAEVNDTQVYLQKKGLGLDECVRKLKELSLFCNERRDSLIAEAEEKALQISKMYEISTERRIGRKKKMYDENCSDSGLSLIQETRREQFQAIDKLAVEIENRTMQMNSLHELFSFLEIQTLIDTEKDDVIKRHIQRLCEKYSELHISPMTAEVYRIRRHIALFQEVNPDSNISTWTALDVLSWIIKWKLQESLSNIVVALRIFLTITVTNASCERSFSKLKLIKSYQRSTMSQERLSDLAMLSIERNFPVNFDNVVENFARLKSRRF